MRKNTALLISLLVVSTARAEKVDLFEMPLAQLLNVPVRSSTLHDESLLEVPSSITVFKREEIQRLGFRKLPELLNHVAGYQAYRSDVHNQGYTASSRGRRTGSSGRELLVLIDGMRLNDDFSGGAIAHHPLLLKDVEKVEVIRGPGSPIYGSNAFLGVVNITTSIDRQVDIEAGNHGERSAFVQIAGQDHEGFGLSVWTRSRSGSDTRLYEPISDRFFVGQDSFLHRGAYARLASYGLNLNLYYDTHESKNAYSSGDPHSDGDYAKRDNTHLSLAYEIDLANDWNWENAITFNRHRIKPRTTPDPLTPVSVEAVVESKEIGLSSTAKHQSETYGHWVLGADWRRPDTSKASLQTSGAVSNFAELAETGTREIWGVFAQNQLDTSFGWRTTFGLRYDHYSDFGGQFSPRLGASYPLNSENTVKVLYGEAFLAPPRAEKDVKNNNTFIGNPDLGPEVSKTTELVWVHLSDLGHIQSTLFYTTIEDNIIEESTSNPRRSRINGGNSKSSGLELEWVTQLAHSWYLRSAATVFFDRALQSRSSESKYLFAGSLAYQADHYSVALRMNHQSEKTDENASAAEFKMQDEFSLFDLHGRYFVREDFELRLTISNLLDKEYLTPAESRSNTFGVDGFSRQLLLGASLSY